MTLITRKIFSEGFPVENVEKYKNDIKMKGFISKLPQLWQLLEELPDSLKNGETWLLSEEIIQYALSSFSFDKLELFLVDERIAAHSQKYVVNLNLQIIKGTELLAQINLTLLSKESWNENI